MDFISPYPKTLKDSSFIICPRYASFLINCKYLVLFLQKLKTLCLRLKTFINALIG